MGATVPPALLFSEHIDNKTVQMIQGRAREVRLLEQDLLMSSQVAMACQNTSKWPSLKLSVLNPQTLSRAYT